MQRCENCYKSNLWQKRTGRIVNGRVEWICRCKHKQFELPPQGMAHIPRILVYDIETSTATFRLYDTGRQYVSYKQLVANTYVLGWAAKWMGESDIQSDFVTGKEAKRRDDRRVVKSLYKLMDNADYVITYNGDDFDNKEMAARYIRAGLTPNKRYHSIDLYKKIKQIVRLRSYSLRHVLDYFNLSPKGVRENTDLAELGDVAALSHDREYCKQDVFSTEELYFFIRPWMKTHPEMSSLLDTFYPLGDDETRCPRCLMVIGRWKWTKRYTMPSGRVLKSCNCPHCGGIVTK